MAAGDMDGEVSGAGLGWGDPPSRLPSSFPSSFPRLPMDAKEVGSLGKELRAKRLLGLRKVVVRAGGILPAVLVYSLLLTASSRLSPSRAPEEGPRSGWAGAVEARAGSLLQNEVPVLPPRCPAAPR